MNIEPSRQESLLTRQILTVTELNSAVAAQLERMFPLVWVAGEISNLTRAASGHWYFSLKDRDAQVRCVMFRGRNQLLDWTPREGDKVEARALVGLYVARGEFQLNIEALQRAGAGSLYEAFLRLKDKLEKEGLFAQERKRALPGFPKCIGIVTSLQAAALRDVLTTLARRAPHVRVVIYPTPVQGAEAPAQIVNAIQTASRRAEPSNEVPECEVLLIVRGGGSIEDLWAFNDEAVARAVAACPVPVVSGVGHETDFTIADFVADVRAPTPTAAAELASPDGLRLRRELGTQAEKLRRAMERRLTTAEQRLDDIGRRLKSPLQRWSEANDQLTRLQQRLLRLRTRQLADAQLRFKQVCDHLYRSRPEPGAWYKMLTEVQERHRHGMMRLGTAQQARLDLLTARLSLLNPASALERGYSITMDRQGRIVRDATQISAGQELQVVLAKGALDVDVRSVHAPSVS